MKVSILTLFLITQEKLLVFHHWVCCLLWAFHIWLYYVEVVSFYSYLSVFFECFLIMKGCWICKAYFLCVSWDDHVSFPSFCWCGVLHKFLYAMLSSFRNKFTCLWYIIYLLWSHTVWNKNVIIYSLFEIMLLVLKESQWFNCCLLGWDCIDFLKNVIKN